MPTKAAAGGFLSLDLNPSVIGAARTDRHGAYTISNLPNCEFTVTVQRHRGDNDLAEAVRSGAGKWDRGLTVNVSPGRSKWDVPARAH